MVSVEMVPYTATERDRVEEDLFNKRELTEDRRAGLVIRTFWLRLTNEVSLSLIDHATNQAYETIIPNDEVMQAIAHPYYYLAMGGLLKVGQHEPRE